MRDDDWRKSRGKVSQCWPMSHRDSHSGQQRLGPFASAPTFRHFEGHWSPVPCAHDTTGRPRTRKFQRKPRFSLTIGRGQGNMGSAVVAEHGHKYQGRVTRPGAPELRSRDHTRMRGRQTLVGSHHGIFFSQQSRCSPTHSGLTSVSRAPRVVPIKMAVSHASLRESCQSSVVNRASANTG
jgi:hypothetical protein